VQINKKYHFLSTPDFNNCIGLRKHTSLKLRSLRTKTIHWPFGPSAVVIQIVSVRKDRFHADPLAWNDLCINRCQLPDLNCRRVSLYQNDAKSCNGFSRPVTVDGGEDE